MTPPASVLHVSCALCTLRDVPAVCSAPDAEVVARVAADLLARWLIAPQELPVGVLTAVLGGSYLLWLMHRRTARGTAS